MPDWAMSLVQLFGPMGFIMYLVWRFQNHTIPRLAAENHDALARQRDDFKGILINAVDRFEKQALEQREFFHATLKREQEFHEKLNRELVDTVKELAGEIRSKPRIAAEVRDAGQ